MVLKKRERGRKGLRKKKKVRLVQLLKKIA